MNSNEILEMLNRVVCFTSSEYEMKQKVIKRAKILVERDNAKMVENRGYFMGDFWGDCPMCGTGSLEDEGVRFCKFCGQRLDWGEE